MKLVVVPSKRLLHALAVDITPYDALTDLVDNSWDNWVSSGRSGKLEVGVTIDPSRERITIVDNAMGIRFEDLSLLFAPGGSNRGGEHDVFGIYGVGAKRAFYALAKEVRIETRHKGEPGYRVAIPSTWFADDAGPDRWDVTYDVDTNIAPGTTTIELAKLNASWTQAEIDAAKQRLQETYADLIRERKMVLEFNGEALSPPPLILWAKSKNVPPTIFRAFLQVPKTDRKVHFELTVGITVDTRPITEIGFDVICNGRLVVEHVSDYRLGFEEGRLGNPHFTLNRFRGLLRLDGEPRDIPWNSSKNDLNLNHPFYREVLGLVVQVSKPFTKFLRKNYALSSTLFTRKAGPKDFKIVEFKPGRKLPALVRPLAKKERRPVVKFEVTREELEQVGAFVGLQDKRPGEIGRYVWDYFLEEVMKRE